MGLLDNARKKLETAFDQHGGKLAQGLDRVAETARDLDRKHTGGKHAGKIDQGTSKAREGLDRLEEKRRRERGEGTAPGTPGTDGPLR